MMLPVIPEFASEIKKSRHGGKKGWDLWPQKCWLVLFWSHAGQSRCGLFGWTRSHLLKTSHLHIVWRMASFIDAVFVHTYKLTVAHLPHPPPILSPWFCLKLLQIRPDKFQINKMSGIFFFKPFLISTLQTCKTHPYKCWLALALGASMLEQVSHIVLLWKRDIGLVSWHVTGWNLDIILTPPSNRTCTAFPRYRFLNKTPESIGFWLELIQPRLRYRELDPATLGLRHS